MESRCLDMNRTNENQPGCATKSLLFCSSISYLKCSSCPASTSSCQHQHFLTQYPNSNFILPASALADYHNTSWHARSQRKEASDGRTSPKQVNLWVCEVCSSKANMRTGQGTSSTWADSRRYSNLPWTTQRRKTARVRPGKDMSDCCENCKTVTISTGLCTRSPSLPLRGTFSKSRDSKAKTGSMGWSAICAHKNMEKCYRNEGAAWYF